MVVAVQNHCISTLESKSIFQRPTNKPTTEGRLSQGTRLKLVPGMAALLAQPSAMPLATSADKGRSAQTMQTPERSLCHVQLREPSGCSSLACDENSSRHVSEFYTLKLMPKCDLNQNQCQHPPETPATILNLVTCSFAPFHTRHTGHTINQAICK